MIKSAALKTTDHDLANLQAQVKWDDDEEPATTPIVPWLTALAQHLDQQRAQTTKLASTTTTVTNTSDGA